MQLEAASPLVCPTEHRVQLGTPSTVCAKNPAPHSVHTVSELALHGAATLKPGAHTAHRSQYACPSDVAK